MFTGKWMTSFFNKEKGRIVIQFFFKILRLIDQSARPMQRGRSSTGSWTGRHAQSLVALVYFI